MVTSKRALPRTVVALGLTSFFTDIGSEMIFPLLPVFIASLGAAPVYLGLIEGLAEATSAFLKLGSGYLADGGRAKKPLVLLGYAIAGLTRPLMGFALAPWHVLAVRVTDRVGKGIRTSPRDALIAASVDNQQAGRAFGFHRAMDHAGAVVGPIVATALLASGWSMREVFWLAVLPGALAILCLLTVREGAPVSSSPEPTSPTMPRPALSVPLRRYFAVMLLFSLGASSDAFLLLRASEVGVPVASLPLLWTVHHVSKMTTSWLGGAWSDRTARAKVIAIGWGVYALTYLGFGFAQSTWHIWLLFVVYGAYFGLTEPAEKALVKELAPAEAQSRAFGIYNFIVGISAIPAGLLTGLLWQSYGPLSALGVGAGLAGVSAIALLWWSDQRPQTA